MVQLFIENPSKSLQYGICYQTQVNAPRYGLNKTMSCRYSIYLPRRDRKLSWLWCWLYAEMVYLLADSRSSNGAGYDHPSSPIGENK